MENKPEWLFTAFMVSVLMWADACTDFGTGIEEFAKLLVFDSVTVCCVTSTSKLEREVDGAWLVTGLHTPVSFPSKTEGASVHGAVDVGAVSSGEDRSGGSSTGGTVSATLDPMVTSLGPPTVTRIFAWPVSSADTKSHVSWGRFLVKFVSTSPNKALWSCTWGLEGGGGGGGGAGSAMWETFWTFSSTTGRSSWLVSRTAMPPGVSNLLREQALLSCLSKASFKTEAQTYFFASGETTCSRLSFTRLARWSIKGDNLLTFVIILQAWQGDLFQESYTQIQSNPLFASKHKYRCVISCCNPPTKKSVG